MASIPKVLRGLAAVLEAVHLIGSGTDAEIAKIVVENEADIRYMLYFVHEEASAFDGAPSPYNRT